MFQQVRKESTSAKAQLARLIRNALHRAAMPVRAAEVIARTAAANGLSLLTRRPTCVVVSHAPKILAASVEPAWTVVYAKPIKSLMIVMIRLACFGSGSYSEL